MVDLVIACLLNTPNVRKKHRFDDVESGRINVSLIAKCYEYNSVPMTS